MTGDGFVDFGDLTILLAHWDQMVSAGQGNLVDPLTTPINFQDLTLLLAAWTGPGPVGAPQAAAAEATASGMAGETMRDTATNVSHFATNAHFDRLGRRDHATLRRASRTNSLSSHATPLRRLQATAVDRAMGEDSVLDQRLLTRRHARRSL